jgi:hypothetical protein
MADVVTLLIVALVVGVAGAAVGILLIGPRLTRWMDRDEESGDVDD